MARDGAALRREIIVVAELFALLDGALAVEHHFRAAADVNDAGAAVGLARVVDIPRPAPCTHARTHTRTHAHTHALETDGGGQGERLFRWQMDLTRL